MPIITVLAILVLYLLINKKYLKEFKVYPLLTVAFVNLLAEILALFLKTHLASNQRDSISSCPYNFSIGIELVCYIIIFKSLFKKKLYRGFLNLTVLMLPLFYVFILVTNIKRFLVLNDGIYLFECFFILVISLAFFIELFLADYFYVSPIKQFYFWLCTGLLICYMGGALYLINEYEIYKISPNLNMILKNLTLYLNCFLYACILIAVECLKKFPTLQIRSL